MTPLIGTSGFQYPEWKGSFYPEKLPAAKMLGFYSDCFPTTEINYTFRRTPSQKTIDNWGQLTPGTFKFSFKAHQKITHIAKLRDCTQSTLYFFEALDGLQAKVGAVLFQLPPSFKRDAPLLDDFLASLPRGRRQAAFEFRHPSWFDDSVFASLKNHNAALCIAESEEFTVPSVVTADFGYVRLRRQDYRSADIDRWAAFIQEQQERWSEIFIYFKHEEAGTGPAFAKELMKKF